MTQECRRAIAYITGRLATSSSATYVYDYSVEKPFQFTGEVSKDEIQIYDFEQHCEITGGTNNDRLWLRDSKTGQLLSLKIGHASFTGFAGYDEVTLNHFTVTVLGDSVHVYDYESNRYYNFRLTEEDSANPISKAVPVTPQG